jgi:hypothetical protein
VCQEKTPFGENGQEKREPMTKKCGWKEAERARVKAKWNERDSFQKALRLLEDKHRNTQ